jgi:hypothetical protein
MSEPSKFVTAGRNPWFKLYALECGCQEDAQEAPASGRYALHLFKYPGCGGYPVRLHDHDGQRRLYWETHEQLPDDRKDFSRLCRAYDLRRKPTPVISRTHS